MATKKGGSDSHPASSPGFQGGDVPGGSWQQAGANVVGSTLKDRMMSKRNSGKKSGKSLTSAY
jgi:hypothetical protein